MTDDRLLLREQRDAALDVLSRAFNLLDQYEGFQVVEEIRDELQALFARKWVPIEGMRASLEPSDPELDRIVELKREADRDATLLEVVERQGLDMARLVVRNRYASALDMAKRIGG